MRAEASRTKVMSVRIVHGGRQRHPSLRCLAVRVEPGCRGNATGTGAIVSEDGA